ncbi:MAG: alpha/beta fold hydrolase [Actinomycetota bacterium]|nr:alpha/beta fold hydrolase [Actinomycetota bacterium]
MTTQMVASAGVHLNVRSSGLTGGPTVLLVHGFPDNQDVWDRVVPLLEPHFHVVTYDVRGAGGSSAPDSRKGYRMNRLVDDIVAVIERVRPDGGPVHLVGHDWGGTQLWGAVAREGTDARLSGRIASFTSISCPSLELTGHFVSSGLRNREFGKLVKQAAHSWYILVFQLPFLPELAFRRFGGRIRKSLTRKQHMEESAHWAETFASDGANGINLYRANRPAFSRSTTKVPVQVIVPTKDAFLIPALYDDVAEFAPDVRRIDIVAGHWVIRTHPAIVADKVSAFIDEHR